MPGQRARQQPPSTGSPQAGAAARASTPPPAPRAARLLDLQSTAGNRAVQRLVGNRATAPVQRQLVDEGAATAFLQEQAIDRRWDTLEASQEQAVSSRVPDPARFQVPATAGASARWTQGEDGTYTKPKPGPAGPPRMVPASVGAGAVPAAPEPEERIAAPSAGAGAAASPAPLTLPDKYRGEEQRYGWRAFAATDPEKLSESESFVRETSALVGKQRLTRYFSPEEREQSTLTPEGGVLRNAQGDAAATPQREDRAHAVQAREAEARRKEEARARDGGEADEADEATPQIGTGTEYAMSPAGEIVINPRQEQLETQTRAPDARQPGPWQQQLATHHSSMLAGGDVAHAGHVGVQGGKVNYLDDDSGHYRPTEAHTRDAFKRMDEQGILAETGKVRLAGKQGAKGVDQASQDAVSVPFHGYRQTGGDEAVIRTRDAAFEQIDDRRRAAIPAKAIARREELAKVAAQNEQGHASMRAMAAKVESNPASRAYLEALRKAERGEAPWPGPPPPGVMPGPAGAAQQQQQQGAGAPAPTVYSTYTGGGGAPVEAGAGAGAEPTTTLYPGSGGPVLDRPGTIGALYPGGGSAGSLDSAGSAGSAGAAPAHDQPAADEPLYPGSGGAGSLESAGSTGGSTGSPAGGASGAPIFDRPGTMDGLY